MNLSPHFTLEEATVSQVALRKGIKNEPNEEALERMRRAALGMEQVRSALGYSIHVSSWLRVLELNRAIGSKDNSDHVLGWAVDFTCKDYGSPLEICKTLAASGINFSQLINEQSWVHISFNPEKERSILTASFDASGKATYQKGLV